MPTYTGESESVVCNNQRSTTLTQEQADRAREIELFGEDVDVEPMDIETQQGASDMGPPTGTATSKKSSKKKVKKTLEEHVEDIWRLGSDMPKLGTFEGELTREEIAKNLWDTNRHTIELREHGIYSSDSSSDSESDNPPQTPAPDQKAEVDTASDEDSLVDQLKQQEPFADDVKVEEHNGIDTLHALTTFAIDKASMKLLLYTIKNGAIHVALSGRTHTRTTAGRVQRPEACHALVDLLQENIELDGDGQMNVFDGPAGLQALEIIKMRKHDLQMIVYLHKDKTVHIALSGTVSSKGRGLRAYLAKNLRQDPEPTPHKRRNPSRKR